MSGVVNLLWEAGNQITGVFTSKISADQIYKHIYPSLVFIITTKGRKSREAISLLSVLESLAPSGAKRRNFSRRYIQNQDGWKELPSDPQRIPFGFWH
ncbi:hypothetical protein QWY20_16750 [Alkalimonas sp. MEB108]|uniref:Uncharacterized protein n=1 Tax=Alkalimonas cellulosilytica TaxID=3058395 RepID=A0ABU7J9C9_9GAMM|nr:hypothetical protein [Alkalimonas sp. MEB108]MEE2003111.1 hypothetical protein [Alkalimonas sp. MEB108]